MRILPRDPRQPRLGRLGQKLPHGFEQQRKIERLLHQRGDTGGGATEKSLMKGTVDASLEGNGWNAFVAGLWQQSDPDSGPVAMAYGVVAQGGFFVTDQVELLARYDAIFPNQVAGPDDFNTLTAGINYFVSPMSHVFVISGDFIYYFDPESDCAIIPAPSTTLDLLTDSSGDQIAFRIQAQIVF